MNIVSITWEQPVACHDMDFEMTVTYADGSHRVVTNPLEQAELQTRYIRQTNPGYQPGATVLLSPAGDLSYDSA